MTTARQLSFDFAHRPAMGREDFLVTGCNETAVAWIDSWPDWPGPALCVFGPAASGKSHLARVWQARSGALLLPARAFDEAADAATLLGEAMACVVDDADSVQAETTLLHLFNLLAERGGHLLFTAKRPPSRWPIGLDDLRSRLAAAAAVGIGAPDEALLGAVMVKLFADRQLRVGEEVLTYLIMRMDRSFEAVHRTVALLDRAALSTRRAVTIPLAREILGADPAIAGEQEDGSRRHD